MKKNLACLLAALACPAAMATTYFVGPTRTHTQLSQVVDLLNPGDVVELDGNATYNGVTLDRSGTAALPITIRGTLQGGQRPVITGNGGADGLRMDVNHYVIEDVVVTNATARCVYLHGHNLTLRRVQVHTCPGHGILGADFDTGDLTLTEVEVYNTGGPVTQTENLRHPIYVATDLTQYPNARFRVEKSWVHDNNHGNAIKSRAKRNEILYNWLETTNSMNQPLELVGPEEHDCPVPNGSNGAQLCNSEVVGNVILARTTNSNGIMRVGGDSVGPGTYGRHHIVNNTFVAGSTWAPGASIIRAFTAIDSMELHNNIFYIPRGNEGAFRILRDRDAGGSMEAQWTGGTRRVVGKNNLVTGLASSYTGGAAIYIPEGWTGTIFASTAAPIFSNINLASPATLDLRLRNDSVARNAGHIGSTSTAGYEIPSPINLPTLQPPRMRPDPGVFAATARPLATNSNGSAVSAISLGAFEVASSVNPNGDDDGDGVPNGVEITEGLNYQLKDNDVFGSARLFSMQQYRDFLNREGDAGGIAFWTDRIQTGVRTRAAVIENFFNSSEFQGVIAPVTRLYFAYFLRIPDYAGLQFWINQYRGGTPLEQISQAFAGSTEFTQTYGSLSNADFVTLVYNNVLERAPDSGGHAYWTGQLNSNSKTRGQVMLGFSESVEYRERIAAEVYVTMMYVGMLRRRPDDGGFDFWVNYLDVGNSGQALINGFLGAPEYRSRFLP